MQIIESKEIEENGSTFIEERYDTGAVIKYLKPSTPEIGGDNNIFLPPSSKEQKIEELEQEVTNLQEALVEQYEDNLTLEEDLANTQVGLVEQYEANMVLEEELISTQEALVSQYESSLVLEEELISTQEALVEQYEANLTLESRINELEEKINGLAEE